MINMEKNFGSSCGIKVTVEGQRLEFRTWAGLFAFNVALILFGEGMNPTIPAISVGI